jgi:hypothetical protein
VTCLAALRRTVLPDLDLWGAVLVVGLRDAMNGRDEAWLGSPDFETVCILAQVDPQAVLRAVRIGQRAPGFGAEAFPLVG